MTNTRAIVLAACITACGGGTAAVVTWNPIPTTTDEWRVQLVDDDLDCTTDADCAILEKPDCCGCTAGGVQGPVAKARKAEVEARLAAACADTLCATVISTDVTCEAARAICVDSTCQLARESRETRRE